MTRITTQQAAVILGLSDNAVREFGKKGWLRAITNSGKQGVGERYYFDRAEVEAFRDGGAPAAKAYRESREVIGRKRGRKVGTR